MDSLIDPSCALLEALVMFFQFIGISALCLSRLLPGTRWAWRGKRAFVVALVGLAVAGAMVGRHDSHFAQFAGLTMTALLIGMIAGPGPIEMIASNGQPGRVESAILG
jgi:hypothetical protein